MGAGKGGHWSGIRMWEGGQKSVVGQGDHGNDTKVWEGDTGVVWVIESMGFVQGMGVVGAMGVLKGCGCSVDGEGREAMEVV